jgi:hypothetical protein
MEMWYRRITFLIQICIHRRPVPDLGRMGPCAS